ncbi:MAG: PAS domain S-box protein [Planctomycetes bacterium]|nr:PAS domain S-box protein [Planctomycetota bacterium]
MPDAADAAVPYDELVELRRLAAGGTDAVLTVDELGSIVALNEGAERLFGCRTASVVGRPLQTLVVTSLLDPLDAELRRCLTGNDGGGNGGGGEAQVATGRRVDGHTFPVQLSLCEAPIGGRLFFVAVVRDLVPMRAAEAERRRLSALAKDSHDAAATISLDGTITHWSSGAERLYGYKRDASLGMHVRTMLPADRVGEWTDRLRRVLAGEQLLPYETQRVTAQGDLVDVLSTMTLLEGSGGEPACVAVTDRDITAQKRSELALRRSEGKTRAIVEAAVDAIVTIWADGRIESVNRAAERLFGYSAAELIGRNVNVLMPSPHRERHDGYIRRYLRTGAPRVMGTGREVIGLRKDGTSFPMDLAISEMRVGDEHMFTGIVRDISEHKRTEQALMQQAESIAQANVVLQEAMARAEQATAAKSAFLANMSHEIRTPMTAILGYTETLVEALQGSEHSEALATIQRNGEHLLTIINDILDLSKVEDGRMTVESVHCSPLSLAAEVRGLMQGRAAAKGIELAVCCVDDIPVTVVTDPTRLRQILVNLVGNAVKFTERGSVQVRIGFEPETGREAAQLVLEVVDTGIGMTDEQTERIFEPFVQADATMTRRFGGTGLGLAITQRMVQLLGGVVTVRSTVGRGSTFRVALPVDVPDGAARTREVPVLRPVDQRAVDLGVLRGMRVLLAEDGPDNQRLIAATLRRAGAVVTVVGDGLRAVDTASDAGASFDVILMDMQMPVLDGYAATTELRRRGYDGAIVALTANAMTGDRERCLAAGCDGYASKPLRRGELVQAIRDSRTARG